MEIIEELNKKPWGKQIAIIIISGDNAIQTEARCFELGVADFVHRPFDNRLVRKRVRNVVSLYQYQEELEQKVEKQTSVLRKQFRLLQQQDYPEYELTQERIEVIVAASALHDVGKIAIPDSILLKPGKLTQEEFEYMKSHTTKGCEILNSIEDAWDEEYKKVSYVICRHHHERYDGKGYPDGLKGEDIPIAAQIVSIADVYDALVNERVYKSAFSKEKAFQMIVTGECGVFSPKLLDCFWNTRKQFENLADNSEE